MGSAWAVYIAAVESWRHSSLGKSSSEVGQIYSCELLHKFRKPEAVFQISQEWIITAPGKRNQSRKETVLAAIIVIKKSQNCNCCRKLRKLLTPPPTCRVLEIGPSRKGTHRHQQNSLYWDMKRDGTEVSNTQPNSYITLDTYRISTKK